MDDGALGHCARAARSATCAVVCVAVALLLTAADDARGIERISAPALFSGRAVLEIDGRRHLLKVGETSPEGVTLVESNSRRAIIEFGGAQREVQLGARISATFAAPVQPRAQIFPDRANMYRTVGSINGLPIELLIDTGATSVVLNAAHARRLGIDFRAIGERGMASTASGVTPIYVLNLDRVRIGEIELRNVRGSVTEGAFPDIPLLGMSFLGRVDMRRDGRVLELRGR